MNTADYTADIAAHIALVLRGNKVNCRNFGLYNNLYFGPDKYEMLFSVRQDKNFYGSQLEASQAGQRPYSRPAQGRGLQSQD